MSTGGCPDPDIPLIGGIVWVQFRPTPQSPVSIDRAFLFSEMYYVYILQSQVTGQFYKGISNHLSRRLHEHNAGYEKATAPFRPWNLVWYTHKPDKSDAFILEAKLKRLTSSKRIIAFIQRYSPVVGGPDEPPVVSVSAKMDFL